MAFDPTFRTSQEYLNRLAGFTGPLRTKQECYRSLAGMTDVINNPPTTGRLVSIYTGSTSSQQISLNEKVASTGTRLTKQEAIRRL